MEDLIIRGETPEDYGAIRSLIVETFRAAYGTGDLEADLVERLRDQSAFGVNISLVALQNDLLVGHVFFSGVRIAEHPDIAACALAPLCVSQPLQRRGIGRQLLSFAVDPRVLHWCNARVEAIGFYAKAGWTVESEPFEIPTVGPHVKMLRLPQP